MNNKIVFTALILGFLALPYMGMAAQKAITVSSVNSAYREQVQNIDEQILALSSPVANATPTNTKKSKRFAAKQVGGDLNDTDTVEKIAQLKNDKHTLEIAHELILESLR